MYSSLAVRWTMTRLPRWADFSSIWLTEFSFVGTKTENLILRCRKNVITGTDYRHFLPSLGQNVIFIEMLSFGTLQMSFIIKYSNILLNLSSNRVTFTNVTCVDIISVNNCVPYSGPWKRVLINFHFKGCSNNFTKLH